MSVETTEKKLYPSQINSKTISARIPVNDYVSFLQESIQNGISLNDWLLLKIYGNDSKVGNIPNEEFIEITKEEILENSPEEVYEYWKDDFSNNRIRFSKNDLIQLLENMQSHHRSIQHYISLQMNRNASLKDVKTQLTILIKNKFKSSKDQSDYRKELFELLNELE
jgi:hypothetical protein